MINLEINMKIKKLFVNFMILLLGNCQDFILIDENCSFDSINFLSKTPQNNRSFYKKVRHTKLVNSPNLTSLQFTQTQMFNTFIKDFIENSSFQIKEFKSYLSIIFSEKQKESNQEDALKERDSISKLSPSKLSKSSSNAGELLILDSENIHEKKFKLKALTFKQNLEIQNMIGLFNNENSDSEESFDENSNCKEIQLSNHSFNCQNQFP